jgi:hypothetical protein
MNRALVVGIDNYPEGHQLNGCVKDAESIYELLSKNGDGSNNFKVTPLINVKDKLSLKNAIVDLFRQDSEIALLYFAGHGRRDFFGYHMVTPDFKQNDLGVAMNQLLTIVRKSPATNKVIILDCCHAAGVGMDDAVLTDSTVTYLYEGMTILASSKHDEKAAEINGHGVFTNLLIEALRGGAADLSGNISPAGIYAYIDKAMGKGEQRPVFKTNISEFISLRMVNPQVPEDTIQKIPLFFPEADSLCSLDPSYEDTNDPTVEHHYIEPYADKTNIAKFKQLQKLQSVGLVVPDDAPYMYFAAMNSKACKLTPLGQHYWRLMSKKG